MNKALWLYPNIKEVVDEIDVVSERDTAWRVIVEYGFTQEEPDLYGYPVSVRMAFKSVKPLLRLRNIGGSVGGVSNNPTGKPKETLPEIDSNIAGLWNAIAVKHNRPPIRIISETQMRELSRLCKLYEMNYEKFFAVCESAIAKDKSMKGTDKWRGATLDYFLKQSNFEFALGVSEKKSIWKKLDDKNS